MKISFKRLGAILMAVAILCSITVAADAATAPTATIDPGRTGCTFVNDVRPKKR